MGGRLSRKGYPSWLPHDWDASRLRPQGVPVDPAGLHGLAWRVVEGDLADAHVRVT